MIQISGKLVAHYTTSKTKSKLIRTASKRFGLLPEMPSDEIVGKKFVNYIKKVYLVLLMYRIK